MAGGGFSSTLGLGLIALTFVAVVSREADVTPDSFRMANSSMAGTSSTVTGAWVVHGGNAADAASPAVGVSLMLLDKVGVTFYVVRPDEYEDVLGDLRRLAASSGGGYDLVGGGDFRTPEDYEAFVQLVEMLNQQHPPPERPLRVVDLR